MHTVFHYSLPSNRLSILHYGLHPGGLAESGDTRGVWAFAYSGARYKRFYSFDCWLISLSGLSYSFYLPGGRELYLSPDPDYRTEVCILSPVHPAFIKLAAAVPLPAAMPRLVP